MNLSSAQDYITLQSSAGQSLLEKCIVKNQGMVYDFVSNNNTTLSGPASLALLLNAINVVYRLKYSNLETREEKDAFMDKLYNSDERFTINVDELLTLKTVNHFFDKINVNKNGMTLLEMNSVAVKLGFGTVLNYAKNESMNGEQQEIFNKTINGDSDRRVIENSHALESFVSEKIGIPAPSGIIANYNPSILGLNDDNEASSFGALAAYHEGKVLLLDGGELGAIWINVQNLFNAMRSIDPRSNIPMGIIAIYELL